MQAHAYAPAGFEATLSARWFVADGHSYGRYVKDGGYSALPKCLKMSPDEIIDTVKKSQLRGRGGAGFPTGLKWSFVPKEAARPKYMVVNADESEPGTFKDRYMLARDPHRLLEGAAIGAFAIGAHAIYFYVRGEFGLSAQRLQAAVEQAYAQGILGDDSMGSGYKLDAYVHRGAGAYICGEETALLESLEGRPGKPRLKPPFPAVVGAFGGPTIINNVETLACIPLIFERGVDWFLKQGSDKNGGPKLICISGHIERPGVYEVPNGYGCEAMIALAGGVWRGRKLKAVIPGGSSSPILVPKPCKALAVDQQAPESQWPLETQVPLDVDNVRKAGSMFGSAGMIILDETACVVRALSTLANFYAHESCGQCSPCREGTGWTAKMLQRLERGDGQPADLLLMKSAAESMMGMTICPLADAMAMPVLSYWAKFKAEFEQHVTDKGCAYPPEDVMPGYERFWEDSSACKA